MMRINKALRKDPKNPTFPVSFRQSFSQWWRGASAQNAKLTELEVLKQVDFLRDNDKDQERLAEVIETPIGPKKDTIHEVSITSKTINDTKKKEIVFLHGYGAGLALFFRNMDGLTKNNTQNWNFHFVDWLGMGCSARPPFRVKGKNAAERLEQTEGFFVDSLEEWRKAKSIESMVLVGHSMGGYLSAVYAMRYPSRVEKLLLVSPVAVPENPYACDDDAEIRTEQSKAVETLNVLTSETQTSNVMAEFTQSQDQATTQEGTSTSAPAKPNNPVPKAIALLWNWNITPFAILRSIGPIGPKLVSTWTNIRFSTLPKDTFMALHNYCYAIFSLKGSSEYALSHLLAPGAFARRSLINRIGHVQCKTVFMYGDRDWMDESAGYAAAKRLMEHGVLAEHHIIKNAGHHCYLDNPEAFNELVLREMNFE
ncbi:cardiolipin-specific phospholipase [Schizosaccharomyces japonicus yFS275]|uniref:Cardiolipin-specific phospholipase n=1 Tax=Schizosaccharomyces japonicus (strain yFS275 / FY16936) TaxID=402676 RepID=B6K6J0_SCHJY|nr:cardiolipin-specific phospholipase [Schizosaccharomyces japonicus yFS275]EEB09144.2 cardiolipin-specific phospholipase [Schizosaccharomyces japonicus yFS275]